MYQRQLFLLPAIWALLSTLVAGVHDSQAIHRRHEQFHARNAPELAARQDASLGIDPPEEMKRFYNQYRENTLSNLEGSCTAENIVTRKEWGNLTPDERREFNTAFKCLHSLPPRTAPEAAPGARNALDDFVVAHVNNTFTIHFSPWLLVWHRHYTWSLEQALKRECGYSGQLPYWDWSKYLDRPANENPLFDGSDTSISGDGTPDPSNQGCNCVQNGPYANFTVNLGGEECKPNPQGNSLGYNPRCLSRKFNENQMRNMKYENITSVLNIQDITALQLRLEESSTGIHILPHVFMGGLQVWIPASPSDPWFFLHHSALDRLWAIWQAQDFATRTEALVEDESVFASRRGDVYGPATHVTLDSTLYISPVFENLTARDAMSPTKGRYCYMYD